MTDKTGMYRAQHAEIGALLRAIPADGKLPRSGDLARALDRLSAALAAHLRLEDRVLYPALLRHPRAGLREKGERYRRDMTALEKAFEAFHQTWMRRGALEREPAAFQREWKGVLGALQAHMDAEERDLYADVDAEVDLPHLPVLL